MDTIGLDLHKRESQLCILTEAGEVAKRRIVTSREWFAAVLGDQAPARILLEASTESECVARCLELLGHEVVVADPNFAPMYATRRRGVKKRVTELLLKASWEDDSKAWKGVTF
jgi:transposase